MNFDSFYNRGQTRRVLKFRKFVVKFPVFMVFDLRTLIFCWKSHPEVSLYVRLRTFVLNFFYGYWCNYNEDMVYKKLKGTQYYNRFARVYYCSPLGLFLIQERLYRPRNIKPSVVNRYMYIFKNIKNCTEEINWYLDDNQYNFGFRGRRLVCLDYAS